MCTLLTSKNLSKAHAFNHLYSNSYYDYDLEIHYIPNAISNDLMNGLGGSSLFFTMSAASTSTRNSFYSYCKIDFHVTNNDVTSK